MVLIRIKSFLKSVDEANQNSILLETKSSP